MPPRFLFLARAAKNVITKPVPPQSNSWTEMRLLRASIIVIAMLTGCLVSWGQVVDVKAVARAVDERYNDLKSLKAAFVEIYQSPGISRTESGTLWLKKPGRMRWEYVAPRQKLFLTDSENAYFYVPGERQARRSSLRKIEDIRS